MTMFLKAIAPQNLTDEEFNNYVFSRDDIVRLCQTALYMISE